MENPLAGHASDGAKGVVVIRSACVGIRTGVLAIVREVAQNGPVPGYEPVADDDEHELDPAEGHAGALENLRHAPDSGAIGG